MCRCVNTFWTETEIFQKNASGAPGPASLLPCRRVPERIYKYVKISKRFFFLPFLLVLSLLAPARADLKEDFLLFWRDVTRRALHTLQVQEADQAEPPKVIDRITYPGDYPDFSFSGEDDLLEIWFPVIRDQDAAIFFYQDQVWMLDCGDERAKDEIVPLLRYLGVTRIDRMINTHPHHDHLNGLYSIHEVCPVGELAVCFPEDTTKHMTAAMEFCKGNDIPVTWFEDESLLSMGDGAVTFLAWLKCAGEEDLNDQSAQFMISYGDCSMLSMADMELRGQHQLFEALSPESLKADILRYPHHGKRFMVEELYQAIDPSLVIITNSPRIPEVRQSTKFLDYKHVPVAYTHRADHALHLITDGRRWLCEELKFNAAPYLNP